MENLEQSISELHSLLRTAVETGHADEFYLSVCLQKCGEIQRDFNELDDSVDSVEV